MVKDMHSNFLTLFHVPESDCEWKDIDESIDLEHTEEEDAEMFKSLSEEIPEEAYIGCKVWYCQAAGDGKGEM